MTPEEIYRALIGKVDSNLAIKRPWLYPSKALLPEGVEGDFLRNRSGIWTPDGIGTGEIDGTMIANDSIDQQHILDDAIREEHIDDGTIVNAHIDSAAAIAQSKLAFTDFASYSPTILNGANAWPHTNTYTKSVRIGDLVVLVVDTLGTNNGGTTGDISCSLPYDAASANNKFIGAGQLFDNSIPTSYRFHAYLASTTTVKFSPSSIDGGGALGTVVFTVQLNVSDAISFFAVYEAA